MTHILRLSRSAAVLAAATALLWPAAHAADASASLQVVSVDFIPSQGLSLQWLSDSAFQSLYAESREAGGLGGNSLQEPAPLASWAAQSLSTGTAHVGASAQAAADGTLALQAQAERALFGNGLAQPHTGSTWAQQAGAFGLSGIGQVTIVVHYTLAATAPLGDGNDSFAQATLSVSAGNLDSNLGSSQQVALWSADLPGGSGSSSGSLSFVVDLAEAGQTGYYDLRANVDVAATAAVPEPGSWALLAGGLGLLAGVARRRRTAVPQGQGA